MLGGGRRLLTKFLRRLQSPDPVIGEMWWASNQDLGIPRGGEHPILVIAGVAMKGGPVQIAPGSSSRLEHKGDRVLGVLPPNDCDPPDCLESYTKFWINEHQRIPRAALIRRIGKLSPEKIQHLRVIKQSLA
jgi:hypothetical protein